MRMGMGRANECRIRLIGQGQIIEKTPFAPKKPLIFKSPDRTVSSTMAAPSNVLFIFEPWDPKKHDSDI
jgi:hypothetical protein